MAREFEIRTRQKRFLTNIEGFMENVFEETLEELKDLIDEEVATNLDGKMVDSITGQLAADGWESEIVDTPGGKRLVYRIKSRVGILLHEGVPHAWEIVAKPGSVLHWERDGVHYYRQRVTHPAMAPRPFIREPFRRHNRKAKQIFTRKVQARMLGV